MSDADIVKEFLIESYENLDRLDQELIALEKDPGDRETLSSIFRTIHSIKGTSGFLAFNQLEKVAHVGESLLARLRDGQLSLTPTITTALLSMVDAVRQMLGSIETAGSEGERNDQELIATLNRLLEPKQEPVALSVPASAAPSPAPAGQADTASPQDPSSEPLPSLGEILVNEGKAKASDILEAVAQQNAGDPRRVGEILVARGSVKPQDIAEALTVQQQARANVSASDSTIRVDVGQLDRLMNGMSELVLLRNQIVQYANSTENTQLLGTAQRLNLLTTELQENVMKARMQPIGNIWEKFPRTVRDVAVSCGKQVRIQMEGKQTELDRTILEAIKDPLTHLVRNAVDHGIETPEVRRAAGKNPEGLLSLRAFHEGGQVIIEITDDGSGLDLDKIRNKAIQKRLISADQVARMSEREITNLIFLPGLSTAAKVTNVSGRGVGMDVVKTNIEKIGGIVDVQSKRNQGSTVRMKIPLTLAIIPALIITSGGDRYAIPQVSLIELVRLEGGEARTGIELVNGAPVHRLRGRLLPLVYLNKELRMGANGEAEAPAQSGHAAETAGQGVNIVVLRADDRQFGLVVDDINDTEEIVVKPLSKQLKSINAYAGSTIMGDGRVALILDVLGLAHRANVIGEVRDRPPMHTTDESAASAQERQAFLLFAGFGDSRMAIPLSTLDRLEEFPVSQIEISGRQWVAQYRGQILPLIRLNLVLEERRHGRRAAQALPAANSGPLQILVLNHEGRSYGLVVDRIIDIVEDRAEVKTPATRACVRYSVVIAERVTELLDVPALISRAKHGVSSHEIAADAVGVAN